MHQADERSMQVGSKMRFGSSSGAWAFRSAALDSAASVRETTNSVPDESPMTDCVADES